MDAVNRAVCQLHPELRPECVSMAMNVGISTVAHVEDVLRLPTKKALEDKQEERSLKRRKRPSVNAKERG